MTIHALLPFYRYELFFHLVSVIAWLAALFYLPRLYVYHCGIPPGTAESARFKVMERRLLKQIATPAMLSSWLFGILLILTPGAISWSAGWWWVKFIGVILMSGFHGALSKWRRDFLNDRNQKPERFYRVANEIPTVLMLVIVFMVIVQP
jgi:putative membrane protein